jgi:hypothetical protein
LSVVFRHKREEAAGENCIMRSFHGFYSTAVFIQVVKEDKLDGEYGVYGEEENCL